MLILIFVVRSDSVFMSRLVDRGGGGPKRQEIILNCVLQIQKYKVGENHYLIIQYFPKNFPVTIFGIFQCQTLSSENSQRQRG